MESKLSSALSARPGAPCGAAPRGRVGVPDCGACEIRGLSFCAALKGDELGSLQAIVRQTRLAPGQLVFHQGDEAVDVFNVVSGVLKLYMLLPDGRRQITGFLFPGNFLGIASGGYYSYSAEAVTEVTLCRFARRQLYPLFERFPKLEHQLLSIATDELTAAQDQMLLLGRKTASERLASFLLGLGQRIHPEGGADDNVVPLPMNRIDVADYLGLTIETVSRALGRLKKAGLIEVPEPHRIAILRRDKLEALAEGC